METGFNEVMDLVCQGFIFARDRETSVPFAVELRQVEEEVPTQTVAFHFRNDRPDVKERMLKKFKDAISIYSPYRSKKTWFGREVGFLPRQNVSWDDLILPQFVLDHLDRYVVDFFRNKDAWRAHGAPMHRSILLSGKPGVGKTLIGKVLADTLEGISFLWVTPAANYLIPEAFSMARELAPSIIFFEDLDFLAASRYGMVSSRLGDFLTELRAMSIFPA
jgi:SpoVK/Ycf46/Vps4 family AAA+-type ATPase